MAPFLGTRNKRGRLIMRTPKGTPKPETSKPNDHLHYKPILVHILTVKILQPRRPQPMVSLLTGPGFEGVLRVSGLLIKG